MQIQFERLRAKNTCSFKGLDLDLSNKGLSIIVGNNLDSGGSNGAGKTTLQKLFFYGLTGMTSEGLKTEDILSDFNPKDSEVEVIFKIGDIEYSVIRYRNHHTYKDQLFLMVNGDDMSKKLKDDTQKAIYELIGMDRESLLLLTLFSVNTINFAKVPPAERRKAFLSLFPAIEKYRDEYAVIFKNKRNKIQEELWDKDRESLELKAKIEALGESKELNEQRKKIAEDKLIKLKKEYEECDATKKEKELINLINKRMVYIEATFPKKVIDNLDKVPAAANKASNKYHGIVQDINLLEVDHKGYANDLKTVTTKLLNNTSNVTVYKNELDKGICAHCGTEFGIDNPPPFIKKAIDANEEELVQLLGEKRTVESNIKLLMTEIEKKIKEKQEAKAQMELLLSVTVELDKINNWKSQQLEITPEILEMEKKIGSLEDDIKDKINFIKQYDDTIKDLLHQFIEVGNQTKIIENKILYYEHLIKVSSIDIPTYLLNKYLDKLEEESSKIMQSLFAGMSIRISDTASTKKGLEKPELSIGIDNMMGVTKDYKSFSGGEKQAIDISLLFGIQRLVMEETGKTPNILFLDEILDISADDVRTNNILEFLKTEAKSYDSMFLISHKSELTEEADSYITVTKKDGISSLGG